jgi:prophage regulatory protein
MNESPQLIRLPEVKSRTGASKSTIYSMEAQGRFPKRVTLGPRFTAWSASEVDAWIIARLEERAAA